MNRLIKDSYSSFEFAFATTVSFMISVVLMKYINFGSAIIGGLWIAISAIVVLQETGEKTKHFAYVRIYGSLIGALVSAIFMAFLPINFITIFVIVFSAVLVCKLFNFEEGVRLAALTVAVIIAVSYINPEVKFYINSLARFFESIVGACIALLIREIFEFIKLRWH